MSSKTPVALVMWLLIPVLAWGLMKLGQQSVVTPWQVSPGVSSKCTESAPVLWMGGRERRPDQGTYVLATNGVIRQNLCQSGRLTFNASGTQAAGLFPLMTVSLNGKVQMNVRVSEQRTFTLDLPEGGEIVVAFHDDRYLPDHVPPEDRNLVVQDWQFTPER